MIPTISENDNAVLQLLMTEGPLGINRLQQHLGITGTAVRQRLSRLLGSGFVDRVQESKGRGRPSYQYRLTDKGQRTAGDNLADLAGALWKEIQAIADEDIRQKVLAGTIRRMADQYSRSVQGHSIEDRLNSVAKLFAERDVPIMVEEKDGLPVLKILACPYPDLGEHDHDICELEKQLITEVVGGSIELCQCRKDGDQCCTFQTALATEPEQDE